MKITVLGSSGFGYPLTFCNCEYCKAAQNKSIEGVSSLLEGKGMAIEPSVLSRKERSKK